MPPPSRACAAAVLLGALAGASGFARAECEDTVPLVARSTLNLRIDNDMFGGAGQDQGYSNGFLLTLVSPNLRNYKDDPCLPPAVQRLNRYLDWLHPEGFDEQNMTLGLGQVLFTPADRHRSELITDDRPYAAALLLSAGYNARQGDSLRTSQIRVGLVGPAALGRQVQNGWHRLIGAEPFLGWAHQLHNEPVVQLVHERRQRWAGREQAPGWGWDAIGRWGASLGNLATYANAGIELRWGRHVPPDFGSAPLGPAGENTAPLPRAATRAPGWAGHLFVAVDTRWVLHDISLDGNTFRNSHHVDKRALVADVGLGASLTYGDWRLTFTRYHRTREFHGQKDTPVYGNFTISRRF